MKFETSRGLLLATVLMALAALTACGGGGGASSNNNNGADPSGGDKVEDTPQQPVNKKPIAHAQSKQVDQDKILALTLVGSDSDGIVSKYQISQQPSHGTLSGSGSSYSYDPNDDFTGTDSFMFTVTDDKGAVSTAAKVTINVMAVQQPDTPPVLPPISGRYIYVAPDGNNANTGDESMPYQTISQAVNQAVSGDVILVRAGTYREKVSISNKQNIAIKAYGYELVTISGADLITSSWSEDPNKPGVFKTSLNSNSIETDYTQVFVDGKFQQMARYPDNISGEMMKPMDPQSGYAIITNASKPAGSSSRSTVTFTAHGGIGEIPNVTFTDEAVVRGLIGKLRNNIFSASSDGAAIQREDSRLLSFKGTNNGYWKGNDAYSSPEGFGFIFDLAVLDRAGEWFYSRDNNELYYKPASGSMNSLTVEAKKRKWAIQLSNSHNITLENIHVKAAAMQVDSSDDLHVTGCSFQYLHPFLYRRSYGVLKEGIVIDNSDNGVYENSLIAHTWGSGIILNSGNNNKIHNNIIEDIGWLGQFTVAIFNEANNTEISQNTMGRASRFHIRTTKSVKSTITDNHMFEAMAMGEDAGVIMMTSTAKTNYLDLKGTEIAYNKIHDIHGIPAMDIKPSYNRQTVKAFYLEDVDNYTVHHNLVFNVSGAGYTRKTPGTAVQPDGSMIYLGPRARSMTRPVNYFNNTFYNYDSFMNIWHHSDKDKDIHGLIADGNFKNNIMMAGKAHKLGGTYMTITLPNYSSSATGSISKIEETSLADYVAEIANPPYGYTIKQSHNTELSQAEFSQVFENPTSHNFRLKSGVDETSNGTSIVGITGSAPIARGAWEGDTLADKDRVFNAGASIKRSDFPVAY
ncbi:hypothetical protein C2869_04340 [Saccharobesus litoralis]|uniref:Uncharacterized protein n=1 Tax=Saccharobesus litoralis TaxID=2172099 RepID=A0A2S0VND0_9ALTE|nr:Ig-like domain-containing protein [Saccharobesus litoralis]AWB65715.1 hypothetical protein C2869_04340 [Saccharobesus litoralis]